MVYALIFVVLFSSLSLQAVFSFITDYYYKCEEVIEKEYSIKQGDLEIDGIAGKIVIHGCGGNTITVKAVKRARNKQELQALQVSCTANTDKIHIRTIQKNEGWLIKGIHGAVDYYIQVPYGMNLSYIKTGAGSIMIHSVEGAMYIVSDTGCVKVEGAKRTVEVMSNAGTVDVQFAGDAYGDLVIKNSTGNVYAHNTAGNICIEGGGGCVEVHPRSIKKDGTIKVETGLGLIEMALPESTNASVELCTTAGTIFSEFLLSKGETQERWLGLNKTQKGIIGTGGPHISLKTNVGAIRLLKRKI